jgi:hypothetical protein
MDDGQRHGDAGDAKLTTDAELSRPTANDTNATGVASDANVAALDDGIKYTLTAEQALVAIATAGRKVPSLRSLQRHCDENILRATKIKTTYGQEWLINEASLARYIERQPRLEVGDAGDAKLTTHPNQGLKAEHDTNASGDASVASDATVALPLSMPAGERRSVADVLIENAKLVAQNEGKDVLIVELKDDKTFLREEVREARKQRDDIKTIAEKMLTTFQNIALRGLLAEAPPASDPAPAEVIKPTQEQDPSPQP